MTLKAILLALALLPSVPAERALPEKQAQQTAIAAAINELARGPEEKAFLLAWGSAESNFALRIHVGACERWECDRGKARGPWQTHQNGMLADRWARMVGVENTRAQVAQAVKHARWALGRCPGDRVRGAFRALGARGCQDPLPGEEERIARFERIRRVL